MISKATTNIDCFIAGDFTTVIDPEILSLKCLNSTERIEITNDIRYRYEAYLIL
jgi:hypothetical protein